MSHDIWQIIDLIVTLSATTHVQREGTVVGLLLPAALRGGERAGGKGCPSVTLPPSLANATSARHGESERRRREAEKGREAEADDEMNLSSSRAMSRVIGEESGKRERVEESGK